MLWYEDRHRRSLDISIRFFEYEREAVRSIRSRRVSSTRYIYFINDANSIEVVLFDAVMLSSNSQERFLRTEIRIGNATISLSERFWIYHRHRHVSSDFIQLLSELLIEKAAMSTET